MTGRLCCGPGIPTVMKHTTRTKPVSETYLSAISKQMKEHVLRERIFYFGSLLDILKIGHYLYVLNATQTYYLDPI